MARYYQHLTDDAIVVLGAGEYLINETFEVVQTGSLLGRFIFREWSPIVRITSGPAYIENCTFINGSVAIAI